MGKISCGMEDITVFLGAQTTLETPQSSPLSRISNGVPLNHMNPETQHCQLLPGLSDDITLDKISPKLSWRDFYILSVVSRGWCHAIRTHQVYDVRVRQRATEKLVLIEHDDEDYEERVLNGFTLFDMRDDSLYQLPPLPRFDEEKGCVTLDGKLYVLLCEGEIYVMDLAGQRKWTQCASREKKVWKLRCGVVHGKIYVFHDFPHDGPEVYDPVSNSWSVIKPAETKPLGGSYVKSVTTVGEELFIYGFQKMVRTLQVYNPAKDEWREKNSPELDASFLRQGKFHSFVKVAHPGHYYVYTWANSDVEMNSLKRLRSCSFTGLGPIYSSAVRVVAVLTLDDDEVLAILAWYDRYQCNIERYDLLRSVGFGSDNEEILWQKIEVSPSIMCPSIMWPHGEVRSMLHIEV